MEFVHHFDVFVFHLQPKSGKGSLKSMQQGVQLLTAVGEEGTAMHWSYSFLLHESYDPRWSADSRIPLWGISLKI